MVIRAKPEFVVAPKGQFVAPDRNLANSYITYLTGITDPAKMQKFLAAPNLNNDIIGKDGEVASKRLLNPLQGAYLNQYQFRDQYLNQFDTQVAAQNQQTAQKVAEVAAINDQNAEANAFARRRGSPKTATGILGLPVLDYSKAFQYGI